MEDSPVANQIFHENAKEKQKHRLLGVLVISNILDTPDCPVVTVVVLQHGSKEFEIESVTGTDDEELIKLAEVLALDRARNTSEDLWTYKLVDC